MEIKRRKFQGVLNILSFNRHFYIIGLLVLALMITLCIIFSVPFLLKAILIIGFLYGLIIPLIVSAYVYDFSGYYKFEWLKKMQLRDGDDVQLLNINAGFDETSCIINKLFPKSKLKVFDFYNEEKHTEPAIVRARKVSLVFPDTQVIKTNYIQAENDSVDVIFLLSAAHEIRNFDEKVIFLKECKRICKPLGKLVMVEHLRDAPNFFAFTIGFTHFFSKHVWKKAFKEAGFDNFEETKFTPFMSIFVCY